MNYPTVIVLASGRGERFLASGGTSHKLQALLAGQTVLQHTLAAVRASGLPWHLEDAGHPGMGDSIAAAVRATAGAHGWLVLPADLPLVQADTLRAVAQALVSHEPASHELGSDELGSDELDNYQVVLPVYQGQRGHPVGFSRACGSALQTLSGPQGAASVVAGAQVLALAVDDVGCVTDIDTVDQLHQAQALLQARRQQGQPAT